MNPFIREWTPTQTPKGAFLLLHGVESHSAWFTELAVALTRHNYAVVAFDRPGSGRTPGPKGHLDSYRSLLAVTAEVSADAAQKFGPTHLAGMSWGGMAALYIGLRKPWLFPSLTLLSPGIVAKHDIGRLGKLRTAAAFIGKKTDTRIPIPFKPEDFTADPEWQRFIAQDPDKTTVVTSGFCIETVKMRRFIKETAGKRRLPPTLCLLAETDAIVNNAITRDLAQKAGAVVHTVPNTAHSLVFDNPEETARRMADHADKAVNVQKTGNAWILGAGAVGGALAALLDLGGYNTGVLTKPAYLDVCRANGITLVSGPAQRGARTVTFAADPADLPADPELVVVAVKGYDTPALLDAVKSHIPASAVIASVQNGVGNEALIATLFPKNTIVAASICAGLELAETGRIHWPDDRGGLAAAVHRGDHERARAVWHGVMEKTGLECAWITGPNASPRLKWSKLMLNIAFNALNSVTGLNSARILRHPEYGSLAVTALKEGFRVMKALKLQPVDLPGYPVSAMRVLLQFPLTLARKAMAWQAERTPEAAFSMRQDILKNRPSTEIGELNGKIVDTGRSLGLTVWANEKLRLMVENRQ